ncbi:MAG: formylglycine-generating enzyme family protein, partial [Arenimonas sp.]
SPLFQMAANHIHGRLNQVIREKIVLANIALDGLRIEQAKQYCDQAKKILPTHPEVIALAKRLDEVEHYERFKPHQVFSDAWTMGGTAPEMVVVPYGQFQMGAPLNLASARSAELPRHSVKFERGFAIARNEVTVGQFRQFIESSGYQTRADIRGWSIVFDEKGGSMTRRENIDWRHDHLGRIAKDELPVVHVNLQDAAAYAKWLSSKTGAIYRLPSEAEFEYVLRSGSDTIYPWGNASPVKVVANLAGAGDKSTQSRSWGNAIAGYRDFHWGAAPVRSFPQEPWGTFDISGNVDEWVLDCWHDSFQRAPSDGSAWVNPGCELGVSRGASWASSLNEARTSFRAAILLKTHNARIGFRVVREL